MRPPRRLAGSAICRGAPQRNPAICRPWHEPWRDDELRFERDAQAFRRGRTQRQEGGASMAYPIHYDDYPEDEDIADTNVPNCAGGPDNLPDTGGYVTPGTLTDDATKWGPDY